MNFKRFKTTTELYARSNDAWFGYSSDMLEIRRNGFDWGASWNTSYECISSWTLGVQQSYTRTGLGVVFRENRFRERLVFVEPRDHCLAYSHKLHIRVYAFKN